MSDQPASSRTSDAPLHGDQGDRLQVPARPPVPQGLTIAISRETGARGSALGRRLGRKLSWQVYDQELLEYLIHDNDTQQTLAASLSPEALDWVKNQSDAISQGLLAGDATVLTFARLSLLLGALGNVVLIGRGAGFLLPRRSTLHVRLIAPLPDRIAFISQSLRITAEEAAERVQARDRTRAEYLHYLTSNLPAEWCDYDLVLNTSSLGEDLATHLITEAARGKTALYSSSPETM